MIPKTLAVNAAKDATELVSKLRAYHYTAQTRSEKIKLAHSGLDLSAGSICNSVERGVLEPALCKSKIIQVRVQGGVHAHSPIWGFCAQVELLMMK